MKVYIAYGWPEGPWQSRKLTTALQKSNYQVTKSLEEADIILSHSAGCYILPSKVSAKLILLIGIPNWPNRIVFKCAMEKVRLEPKDSKLLYKTVRHVLYGLFRPIRLYTLVKTYRRQALPEFKGSQVVVVHNQLDTFMNETVSRKLANQNKWLYKNLNGQHDDLWDNPSPYVEIIEEQLLNTLA
jgi:hypothetical protein